LIRPRFAAAVASVSTSAGVKCKPCRAVIRIVSASRWPYHLARKKNGVPSTHPLKGDEIRALRQLRRDWPDGRFVFVTERGTPFTRSGLSKMVEAAGKEAKFDFPVHFHMLRHACGYYYANRGEDTRALQLWLGHKSIQHTVRYSELSAERFKDW